MKHLSLFLMSLMLCALWAPEAGAAAQLYSDAQLRTDKGRYTQKFQFLYEKGLWAFMSPEERRALRGTIITHPLRGAGPVSFKSALLDGKQLVRAPVKSLKFIEDLSVAYAWRYQNNYSLEPMDEYLFLLKHRPGVFSQSGHGADPMTALGVPPKIWERDRQVDDLSLRFRNTAWAFVLAHELGHVRYGHLKGGNASPAAIQRQEEAADAFAADLLARSDTIPMGMILWFQATAGYMKNRADFASGEAYAKWLRSTAAHPVNGRRLQNLAALMQHQAVMQRDAKRRDVLAFIATRLVTIGDTIEDPAMQRHLARCAKSRRPADLKRRRDRPCN